MILSKAIEGFYLSYRLEYTQGTAENYKQSLTYFMNWLGDGDVDAITLTDLQKFMLHMRDDYSSRRLQERPDHRVAPSTIDNYWKALRAFYRWAESNIDADRPDLKLPRPRYESPEISPFTHDQLEAILDACQYTIVADTTRRKPFRMRRPTAKRDTAIIMVLLDTGVRLGELLRLRIADVNTEAGEIVVAPHGSGRKTKARTIPIGQDTQRAIWRYLATRKDYEKEDDLFPSEVVVTGIIRRLGERLGFHCHPHRFRHTFATLFLTNGGDIYSLKRILGHSSLKMVEHYLHLVQSDVKGAHKRASPVDRLRFDSRACKRNTGSGGVIR